MEKIFTAEFIFNILLHITILFCILSSIFILYISKLTENIITNEIYHIIDDELAKNTKINDTINNYNNIVNNTQLNDTINNYNNIINNTQLNDTINNYNNIISNLETNNIISNYNNNNNNIDILKNKLEQINNNFSYDYYYKVYSKPDTNRTLINTAALNNIKVTCCILIIVTFLFGISLYMFGNLTGESIKNIILENIITFIFIGIIEVLFFTKIILYYSPITPSLFYSSIINILKEKFN